MTLHATIHAAKAIVPRMPVFDQRGRRIGAVDTLSSENEIRLSRSDSPDGRHHYIPLAWVDRVDHAVHLNKGCADIYRDRD